MPQLAGVLETSLYVEDLERSIRFYQEVMQFQKLVSDARFCALQAGQREVLLLFRKGASTQPLVIAGGTIPPHDGSGQTKAYRYFDDVKDAGIVFRKRALPKGGAIGMHVLGHDEVYYVLSGQAELTVDDVQRPLQPSTAVYMAKGANVGIRQAGDDDLVLIVAYPAPK